MRWRAAEVKRKSNVGALTLILVPTYTNSQRVNFLKTVKDCYYGENPGP